MILNLSGHIGDNAAALVDGQLSPEASERAWAHVVGCAGCRRVVEYEAWTKKQVGLLSQEALVDVGGPSSHLMGSLYSVHDWAAVDALEHDVRRSRLTTAAVGVGAVGMMVAGLFAISTPPAGPLGDRGETQPMQAASFTAFVGAFVDVGPRIGDATGLPAAQPDGRAPGGSGRLPR